MYYNSWRGVAGKIKTFIQNIHAELTETNLRSLFARMQCVISFRYVLCFNAHYSISNGFWEKVLYVLLNYIKVNRRYRLHSPFTSQEHCFRLDGFKNDDRSSMEHQKLDTFLANVVLFRERWLFILLLLWYHHISRALTLSSAALHHIAGTETVVCHDTIPSSSWYFDKT